MAHSSSKAILRVALPVPLRQLFDYLPANTATIPKSGMRVEVPFGRRKMVGVIVEIDDKSDFPLEKLASVASFPDGEQTVLTDETLELLKWCWRYYKHAPGEVVFNALPPLLRKISGEIPLPPVQYCLTTAGQERLEQPPGRVKAQIRLLEEMRGGPVTELQLRTVSSSWRKTLSRLMEQQWVRSEVQTAAQLNPVKGPALLDEQRSAVDAIDKTFGNFHCHLLDGVTGSGKTEVYLCLIEQVLKQGGQVLLLVPEIGLTPQLLNRFKKRLGFEPVVTHSGLSEGQRLKAWAMAKSGLARLVIGTRSALFLPMPELQLIILDEEHDASLKPSIMQPAIDIAGIGSGNAPPVPLNRVGVYWI
jgi:primosomal protein N' (replication factor Y)